MALVDPEIKNLSLNDASSTWLTPIQYDALKAEITHVEAGFQGSDRRQIQFLVGKYSLVLGSAKLSEREAEARLQLFVEGLDDIPPDILITSFKQASKDCEWMTIKSIRDIALKKLNKRRMLHWNLKMIELANRDRIAMQQEQSERQPVPFANPADLDRANCNLLRLGQKRRWNMDGTTRDATEAEMAEPVPELG